MVTAAAWSLLLLGGMALWALSYWRLMGVSYLASGEPQRGIGISVDCGQFEVFNVLSSAPGPSLDVWSYPASEPGPERSPLPLWFSTERRPGAFAFYGPLWPIALLLIPFARSIHRLWRHCGYDLTATASGRCPECGAEVPPVAAAEPPRVSCRDDGPPPGGR